jgi:hypothetical protein
VLDYFGGAYNTLVYGGVKLAFDSSTRVVTATYKIPTLPDAYNYTSKQKSDVKLTIPVVVKSNLHGIAVVPARVDLNDGIEATLGLTYCQMWQTVAYGVINNVVFDGNAFETDLDDTTDANFPCFPFKVVAGNNLMLQVRLVGVGSVTATTELTAHLKKSIKLKRVEYNSLGGAYKGSDDTSLGTPVCDVFTSGVDKTYKLSGPTSDDDNTDLSLNVRITIPVLSTYACNTQRAKYELYFEDQPKFDDDLASSSDFRRRMEISVQIDPDVFELKDVLPYSANAASVVWGSHCELRFTGDPSKRIKGSKVEVLGPDSIYKGFEGELGFTKYLSSRVDDATGDVFVSAKTSDAMASIALSDGLRAGGAHAEFKRRKGFYFYNSQFTIEFQLRLSTQSEPAFTVAPQSKGSITVDENPVRYKTPEYRVDFGATEAAAAGLKYNLGKDAGCYTEFEAVHSEVPSSWAYEAIADVKILVSCTTAGAGIPAWAIDPNEYVVQWFVVETSTFINDGAAANNVGTILTSVSNNADYDEYDGGSTNPDHVRIWTDPVTISGFAHPVSVGTPVVETTTMSNKTTTEVSVTIRAELHDVYSALVTSEKSGTPLKLSVVYRFFNKKQPLVHIGIFPLVLPNDAVPAVSA